MKNVDVRLSRFLPLKTVSNAIVDGSPDAMHVRGRTCGKERGLRNGANRENARGPLKGSHTGLTHNAPP
jgi:hypothetical protein